MSAASETLQREEAASYRAPIADILLALDTVGLDALLACEAYAGVDRAAVSDALVEFGRLAGEVIGPTDRPGDAEGCRFDPPSGAVTTPKGFKDAFRRFAEGGWGALQFPTTFGGGGLPTVVGLAVQEMFASANVALSLNPALTQSGIELLLAWGSAEQQTSYLVPMLSGRWSGTMNLTEPEAGSDLSEVRTSAERLPDGSWRLSGTKIFITWGEHDLSENIVHFVLARTPQAPPGTRGLSLFVVPKFLVDHSGGVGGRNAVRCERIEQKLGIHGSPTCVMTYDGAVAELVGEEHAGLRAMFTMMNVARVAIGIEGPAIAERAFQQVVRYATERRQGQAEGVAAPERSAIIEHPDVRRMLLRMRTTAQAGRLLCYEAMAQRDLGRHGKDAEGRAAAAQRCDLFTPIAKAWSTDTGIEAASLGIQVFGGSGYLDDTGIAQRLRDARIASIYEGTNGIQAIDLVTRKLGKDESGAAGRLLSELRAFVADRAAAPSDLSIAYEALGEAVSTLEETTRWVASRIDSARDDVLAGAGAYLELAGTTVAGWLMVRRALAASSASAEAAERAIGECDFFATEFVGRATGLRRPITAGAGRLAAI